jgi:hypothetical protein
MKNESSASAHIKNMLEHPASAAVNISLTADRRNDGYKRYINFVDACIDNGRGYKGKNETHGRPAGTRVLSMVITNEAGEEEEVFYVG